MDKTDNNIMIYEDKDGITKVNVTFTNEDIWLTQNQLADIYKTTQQNISQHIVSIYKDNELPIDSTNKKFLLVQKERNINKFLLTDDLDVLKGAEKILHEIACDKALTEFEKYREKQDKLHKSDFDLLIEETETYGNNKNNEII